MLMDRLSTQESGDKMEKFLIDREDAIAAVRRVIGELVEVEENEDNDIAALLLKETRLLICREINKIDPQKIEGIDFTYGGRIPQEMVDRCQLHEDN